MKTKIYKAQFDTPFGNYLIAVDSIEQYASNDLRNAAMAAFNMPIAILRLKNVKQSNRRILASMSPIKNCISNSSQWGWFKRMK